MSIFGSNYHQIYVCSFKITNIDLKNPAQRMRGNRLRLRREVLKSRIRNNFARSFTQRHNFFTNRGVPRWNKLPETVVSAQSLVS